MKKVYVIAGEGTTFLSKNLTKNGKPKFFEPSTFDNVWVTDDKFEAEEKWHSLRHSVNRLSSRLTTLTMSLSLRFLALFVARSLS